MACAVDLRTRAAQLDLSADAFLAWADRAFAGAHSILGQDCGVLAATLVRQASILREEAAWLEHRWAHEVEAA